MELTNKGIAGLVIGTVLTVVTTSIVTWLIVTSQAGMDAAERARIETVIEEETTLADGRTYGQVLLSLDKNVAVMAVNMELLAKALDAETASPDDQ